MLNIRLTDASDPDFSALTQQLDDEYYQIYGDIVLQYRQHNTPDGLICVAVAYEDGKSMACGAFKRFDENTAELKRIYVQKPYRRNGIAKQIVYALEKEATRQGFKFAVLETGADMIPAQTLYQKLGYSYMQNFGPFAGDKLCVCMEKTLVSATE